MSEETAPYRPTGKIVRRAEMEASESAADYLKRARMAAAEARASAEGELNQARELALATALNDAREALLTETEKAVEEARVLLRASEDDLLSIVRQTVSIIIGSMPDGERMRNVLRQALARAEGATAVTLLVPPGEVSVTREEIASLTTVNGSSIRAVESDPLLSPGDMVLVTPRGRIQVGWRRQLERLVAAMRTPDEGKS